MTFSSSLRILVTTTALACTALVAQAHQTEAGGAGQSQRPTAENLAELKGKLNLSAEQQNAWTQYEAAIKPADRKPASRNADKPALTEEQKAEINKKREEGKQARENAKNNFRSQLNAEQQKIFDAETSRPAAARSGNQRTN